MLKLTRNPGHRKAVVPWAAHKHHEVKDYVFHEVICCAEAQRLSNRMIHAAAITASRKD